jgi:hypothetical protein
MWPILGFGADAHEITSARKEGMVVTVIGCPWKRAH